MRFVDENELSQNATEAVTLAQPSFPGQISKKMAAIMETDQSCRPCKSVTIGEAMSKLLCGVYYISNPFWRRCYYLNI